MCAVRRKGSLHIQEVDDELDSNDVQNASESVDPALDSAGAILSLSPERGLRLEH